MLLLSLLNLVDNGMNISSSKLPVALLFSLGSISMYSSFVGVIQITIGTDILIRVIIESMFDLF